MKRRIAKKIYNGVLRGDYRWRDQTALRARKRYWPDEGGWVYEQEDYLFDDGCDELTESDYLKGRCAKAYMDGKFIGYVNGVIGVECDPDCSTVTPPAMSCSIEFRDAEINQDVYDKLMQAIFGE